MEQKIRHRRLHAFFQSKVLNVLLTIAIICIMIMVYSESLLLPLSCALLAMALFIAYALWFWIKKPKTIVINDLLSSICSAYVFYYLIVAAFDATNQWFYIIPALLGIPLLFLALTNTRDQSFEI